MPSMGSGAAEGLQQVLQRLFLEAQFKQQSQLEQAKLAEDQRQADMQNEVQQGQLGLGHRRTDLDTSELGFRKERAGVDDTRWAEQAPARAADVTYKGALTGELIRKPQAEQEDREFTTGRDKTLHGYRLGQIGAEGAEDRRTVGARAAAERSLAGPSQTPEQVNEVKDTLDLIARMSLDPALPTSVGPIDQYTGQARDITGVERFKSLHENLVGKLALAQAGKLKGQGQISDKERALLMQAATALRRGLSEKDYRDELARIKTQFERMQLQPGNVTVDPNNLGGVAPTEYDYVPGKGLVPRGRQ